MAERLQELLLIADSARKLGNYTKERYTLFREVFTDFNRKAEEFQLLSHLTEDCLTKLAIAKDAGYNNLEEWFRRLQVPMLRQVIHTSLLLLKVWEERCAQEGLPIGIENGLRDIERVVQSAREQLLRPRYEPLLDDATSKAAEEASALAAVLLAQAPMITDFSATPSPRAGKR